MSVIKHPRVSIVMATYNRAHMLDRAIEVVLQQNIQDWELVIIDDASQDNTPAVIQPWLKRDPRIVYVRHETNQGISRAYNTGFHNSRGEFIAMMDDDDAWCLNDKLERQIKFLASHPDYVGCGGGLIVVDPHGREKYRYLKPQHDDQIRHVMLLSNPMANSTTMFRRAAAEAVGWYEGDLRLSGDRDFWMKMARVGKLHNFPEYLSFYTMGDHNNSIVHIRQQTGTSLMLTRRYRKDFPQYPLALLINTAQYAYSFLPLGLRRFIHARVARTKRAVEMSAAAAAH
jgi:hypothetical protein